MHNRNGIRFYACSYGAVQMALAEYFVVLHEGQWKINYHGMYYGPYASEKEAIDIAIKTANEAGQENVNGAQVYVLGPDRKFQTEWIYNPST